MTLAAVHPDEEVRRRIRQELDETFLVEAGAGTGKTSALVERVVALVLAGRKVERIVAITFTDKAAAELRDRVRVGLEAAGADDALTDEGAGRLREALASLDRAHISTIHSFCQAVLRQFAPELSVDPAFELQDEVLADRRFEERWRLYLDRLGRDEAAIAVVNRALDLGLTTANIATLAMALWKQPELAPLLRERPLLAPPSAFPDCLALAGRLRRLRPEDVIANDRLRIALEGLIQAIEGVMGVGERDRELQLVACVATFPGGFGTYGQRAAWGSAQTIDNARTEAQAVCDALRAALQDARSRALAGLLPYVVDFVTEDTRERGREGKLVFDDLILRVRELLTKPGARAAIRGRFDCILIDEFQDTDPLQVDIAWAFGAAPGSEHPEPGRLFLVGDPKQSIYRFRRADMAVYSATRGAVEDGGGATPGLRLNRRSRGEVVRWVNAVFGRMIGPGDRPGLQPPYRDIDANREATLRGPGVAWIGGALDQHARDVRAAEARDLAGRLRAVLQQGWQVQDRATAAGRPAAYGDIAVLVPTRAILTLLERALQDAAVPYRVEGGSLIYGTQEVRDVINCLTAVGDPADEVAIVGALRSPAYACSDVELAAFRLEGGRFDYLRRDLDERNGRVAEALRDLRAFHQARHQGSLAALLERFLTARGLVEVGILDQATRTSFRRARFMVEQAREFEASGPESLRAFVSWLERRATRAVLDNEGAALDDDEDAVRVLTVHGAKGLEFPIVFMAGLGVAPAQDRRVFGMDRATGEIAVSIGARTRGTEFTLGPVGQINAQELQHLRAERDRLLYVAATRARDHLVVSLYHKVGAADSGAARLIAAGARDGVDELAPIAPATVGRRNALETLVLDDAGALENFDSSRQSLVAAAHTREYTSATALRGLPEAKFETSDETEPWARGRGATHVGRAVHAALQSVAWDAGDAEVEAVARAQATAEAVPDRVAEVAMLVRRGLASEAASRARSARRALREVPFAMPARGGRMLVEGFMDLVLEGADGIEIVDWKTDDVSAAEAAERLRQYELQAGLYVLGLRAATGRPVTRVTYVFLRPGLELSPGEPDDLAGRALAVVTPPGPDA